MKNSNVKTGVRVLTVKEALKLAKKKGVSLFRASNRSPLGAYYLNKYANPNHELKFYIKVAA